MNIRITITFSHLRVLAIEFLDVKEIELLRRSDKPEKRFGRYIYIYIYYWVSRCLQIIYIYIILCLYLYSNFEAGFKFFYRFKIRFENQCKLSNRVQTRFENQTNRLILDYSSLSQFEFRLLRIAFKYWTPLLMFLIFSNL